MSAEEIENLHDFVVKSLKEGLTDRQIKLKCYEHFPRIYDDFDLKAYIAQIRNAKDLRV